MNEIGGLGSFMIRPDSYLTMRPAQRQRRTEERASRPGGEGRQLLARTCPLLIDYSTVVLRLHFLPLNYMQLPR